MSSKITVDYDALLMDCIDRISVTGGDVMDAMIIEGHFGLMGDWIVKIIERIKAGVASLQDVILIKKNLEAYPY